MNAPDVRKANRRIVGFCRGGENRPKAYVVRAVTLRRECLLKAVRGFSDHDCAICFASREFDRVIILPHMHAFHHDLAGYFSVIVHD